MHSVPTNEVAIRPAETPELPAILDLLHENGLPDAGLADHVGTVLVAFDGQRIVGSAGLETYGPFALLRSVSVHPSIQKQGLWQRLTQAALNLAKQHDIKQVFLLTETAAHFVPRFGFQAISRTEVPAEVQQSVEFTAACPQSALVMVLKL